MSGSAPPPRWSIFRRRGRTEEPDAETLLQRAARCYQRADLLEDAARLCLEIGEILEYAVIQERRGLQGEAGHAFARAAREMTSERATFTWRDAARCFGAAGLIQEQADALERSGDLTHAGWILAHRAQRYQGARALVERVAPSEPTTMLEVEAVRARCDGGSGRQVEACRRLHRVVSAMHGDLPPTAPCGRLIDWGIATAAVLSRYDLAATLHMAAIARKLEGAEERWHNWKRDLTRASSKDRSSPVSGESTFRDRP